MREIAIFRHAQNGVTLVELLVVVTIVAILGGIAVPSYQKSVTKTRRRAAEACISNYAGFMERYYTTNLRYVDGSGNPPALPVLDCATPANTGTYYTYSFSGTVTAPAYTLRAVPQGTQATRDTRCATLTLDQAGVRGAGSTPADVTYCW